MQFAALSKCSLSWSTKWNSTRYEDPCNLVAVVGFGTAAVLDSVLKRYNFGSDFRVQEDFSTQKERFAVNQNAHTQALTQFWSDLR